MRPTRTEQLRTNAQMDAAERHGFGGRAAARALAAAINVLRRKLNAVAGKQPHEEESK